MNKTLKSIIHWFPRITILVFTILIILFALLSGAETFGGGVLGVVKNSPNALPWLILLLFVWLAWKKPFIGGISLIVLSVLFIVLTDAYENMITFLIILLPILISGIFFIWDSYLKKR